MSEEQIIRDRDGNAQFVVPPVDEYPRLRAVAEDATDAAAAYAARKRIDEGEELVPAVVANRLFTARTRFGFGANTAACRSRSLLQRPA